MTTSRRDPGQPERCPPKHLVGLDLLRFAAAGLVAAHHFGFAHFANSGPLTGLISEQAAVGLGRGLHFGWIGVEVFFVISGYVIALSTENATSGRFAASRFLRLAPAVWICAPITLVLYWLILPSSLVELLPAFFRTVAFIPVDLIDGVYWTLGIEVSFYVLVFLILRFRLLKRFELVPIGLGLLSLAFWIACYATLALTGDPQSPMHFVHGLVLKAEGFRPFQLLLVQHGAFFALGMTIRLLAARGFSRLRLAALAISLPACLLEINAQNGIIERAFDQELPMWPSLVAWSLAMVLLVAAILANPWMHRRLGAAPRAVVRQLGLLTYPLYLIHNPVGLSVALLAGLVLPGGWALVLAGVAALMAAALVSAWLEPALRRRVEARVSVRRETRMRAQP